MLTEKNKENRKKGIGASEAAIVMGLNPNISPYQLWLEKTGRAEHPDLSDVPQVYWGNILEDIIAQEYEKRNNCKVRRVTNTLFHKEFPFMLCHLDRKIEGLSKALECKFAMAWSQSEWGKSGTDEVPLPYIVQVQYQMAVTDYQEGDLAVNIGGCDYRQYSFKRDEELIKKIMADVSEFWECVIKDSPPPLRDWNDAVLAYPFSNGNLIEAEDEIVKTVDDYRNINTQIKLLDSEKQKMKTKLTLFMKDAEGIRSRNEVLATWKTDTRGVRTLRIKETRI